MTIDLAQKSIESGLRNPQLMAAALALYENRLHDAEPLLKLHLKRDPFDVAAIRMLAELAGRIGRFPDAENLLRRAVELAPGFVPARSNLALVLYRQGRPEEAIAELDHLLDNDPEDIGAANLKAAAAGRIGDYTEAVALYEMVLKSKPNQEKIWLSYGHVLKTVGRRDDSVSAYRKAVALKPEYGEAYWSLANLKTARFSDDELALMQAQLARDDITLEDRFHLDFALGKAFEDRKLWDVSFSHYAVGNQLRRSELDYDAAENSVMVDRRAVQMTPEFFASRSGGCDAADPIFILGMPRAGSTLIEQILASHSLVEGTQELPDIGMISQRIAGQVGDAEQADYCQGLANLTTDDRCRIGAEYISRTRIYRKTARPYFIDKMPNNWQNVALIHLILPNAKIIDARRHPMDCCFSNFKQHFARGQSFSYDLADVGQYYADYVGYMQHADVALPGRVHRVIHEALVADPETEIRSLLAYLGLPFEEGCLHFWQNGRAVQTPSAEQVRRPINRDGMDRWHHYQEWLNPLKRALGPIVETYNYAAI
jgi:cytochrome c-type biogenesis protein CcmH/NrfG